LNRVSAGKIILIQLFHLKIAGAFQYGFADVSPS